MKAGLSIVVPLYNEANNLARLHAQLNEVARKLSETRDLSVEVVYVDDGSGDETLRIGNYVLTGCAVAHDRSLGERVLRRQKEDAPAAEVSREEIEG